MRFLFLVLIANIALLAFGQGFWVHRPVKLGATRASCLLRSTPNLSRLASLRVPCIPDSLSTFATVAINRPLMAHTALLPQITMRGKASLFSER